MSEADRLRETLSRIAELASNASNGGGGASSGDDAQNYSPDTPGCAIKALPTDRAKAHKVVAAIHNGTAEVALQRIAMGFQFVTISSDARLIAAGAQAVIAKMRGAKTAAGSKSY